MKALFAGRRWPYVALTALVAGAVAWWAIPNLDRQFAGHVTYAGNDVGPALPTLSLDTFVTAPQAQVMLLAAVVAFLVQLYSTTYLADDKRYRSYALLIVLFLVAMVAVVATDNLFVLLIGWEVMGVCSYLLIGHHWEREDAQSGAAKALLVTRIADIGLLLAILVIGQTYGTYSITGAVTATSLEEPRNATLIGLLLIVAIAGKSAQVPLQTWLPDAMPGPTPITALIHAATMVAAGVHVMASLLPLYETSVVAMATLAVVAATTMLAAALFALAQSDLKRALAWSTVSQLAYMYAAVAVAAPKVVTDHLVSHGVFKALLFLGCGVAMHAVGTSALSAMGGLRKSIPVTFWTMTAGFAALAGLVPTVGFFSKDAVLHALHEQSPYLPDGIREAVFGVAIVTAGVTAAYAARLWFLTFLGQPKPRHAEPKVMVLPLLLLAGATFALSVVHHIDLLIGAISTGVAVAGILVAFGLRGRGLRARFGGALEHELRWDTLISGAVPAVTNRTARLVAFSDDAIVDAYPRGSAHTAVGAAWLLDRLQSAKAQLYSTAIVVGALVLIAVGIGVTR